MVSFSFAYRHLGRFVNNMSVGPAVRFYRRRVREVAGIKSCYTSETTGKGAYIDASIATIIDRLNRLGYVTVYSCSGLPEDHSGRDESAQAYVVFRSIGKKLRQCMRSIGFYPVSYAAETIMYAAKQCRGEVVRDPDGRPMNGNDQRLTPRVMRMMWRRLRAEIHAP